MTNDARTRAFEHLCQRFYPCLWARVAQTSLRGEWLRTMAGLPPREWLVLMRLEKQLTRGGREDVTAH